MTDHDAPDAYVIEAYKRARASHAALPPLDGLVRDLTAYHDAYRDAEHADRIDGWGGHTVRAYAAMQRQISTLVAALKAFEQR